MLISVVYQQNEKKRVSKKNRFKYNKTINNLFSKINSGNLLYYSHYKQMIFYLQKEC